MVPAEVGRAARCWKNQSADVLAQKMELLQPVQDLVFHCRDHPLAHVFAGHPEGDALVGQKVGQARVGAPGSEKLPKDDADGRLVREALEAI